MGQSLSTRLEYIRSALSRDEPVDQNDFSEFVKSLPYALWWKDQNGATLLDLLFNYLTRALERHEPLDQFRKLITPQTSQVIIMQNKFGCTLVHIACQHNPNAEDIISFLLERCPTAARVSNQWNQTPLHIACIRMASLQVVRRLVEACPQAVRACDYEGQTPLHDACKHGAPLYARSRQNDQLDVIRYLAMKELTVCLTPDEDGELPLDLAPRCYKRDEAAIQFLTTVTNAAAGAVTDQLFKSKINLRWEVLGPVASFLHDGSEELAICKMEFLQEEVLAMAGRKDIRANILSRIAV